MPIHQVGDKKPVIPESCCISPEVVIIGEIILGEQVSILPGVVLRAGNEPIVVDDDGNIRRKMCCTPSPAYR
jgi:carbonic anhydrase/acetyltransferase-like protein (isoleucine patch superfamily)